MDIRILLVILHVIGTVIGAGAATVTDYLVFKFAKDAKIDKDEFQILHTISDLIWAGLFILLATGFGFILLHLADFGSVRDSYNVDKIWAKITIVIILTLNGFFIHYYVLPTLKKRLGKSLVSPSILKKSFLLFSPGAISAVSWYTALILGAWRGLDASYGEIMSAYVAILAIAIIVSNIAGRSLLKKR
ncbi:MAG TPA: hypothetical protein VJI96_04445 [Candidatus Andersenbacteria bacterium]|nr:hypothetical protein [Candidatus Andersenbacteria bacterium]